jgi:mono/diheme cytochrome c family protein
MRNLILANIIALCLYGCGGGTDGPIGDSSSSSSSSSTLSSLPASSEQASSNQVSSKQLSSKQASSKQASSKQLSSKASSSKPTSSIKSVGSSKGASSSRAPDVASGKNAYEEICASCHGVDGRDPVRPVDTGKYPSVESMVIKIRDTMPLGKPEECQQICAEDVTAYIKNVLSKQREKRHAPLAARLSKYQYTNALADLFNVTLSAAQLALLPDDIIDETSFSTVIDGQPMQADHVRAYNKIAEAITTQINAAAFVQNLSGCSSLSPTCGEETAKKLGGLLFRRPLTASEKTHYAALFAKVAAFQGAVFSDASKVMLQAMLQAPPFLYRLETEVSSVATNNKIINGYELASRLSLFIWQSVPDSGLLSFAEKIQTGGFNQAALETEVQRLLSDAKSARARDVFWDDYTVSSTSAIDTATPTEANELRGSLLEMLRRNSGSAGAEIPLQQLFTLKKMILTPNVATKLGLTSAGTGYREYDTSAAPERVGFLSHPGYVANMGTVSFVGRGVLLSKRILCQNINAPIRDAAFEEKFNAVQTETKDLTPRQAKEVRFNLGEPCVGCHKSFEPIAFGFERFTVLGQYAQKDALDRALFSDGYLQNPDGSFGSNYSNFSELMSLLETSQQTSQCFVQNMMVFAMGRDYLASDKTAITSAHTRYLSLGGTYSALVKAVALSPAFRQINTVTGL